MSAIPIGEYRDAMVEAPVEERGVGRTHQFEAAIEEMVDVPDEALPAFFVDARGV